MCTLAPSDSARAMAFSRSCRARSRSRSISHGRSSDGHAILDVALDQFHRAIEARDEHVGAVAMPGLTLLVELCRVAEASDLGKPKLAVGLRFGAAVGEALLIAVIECGFELSFVIGLPARRPRDRNRTRAERPDCAVSSSSVLDPVLHDRPSPVLRHDR